MRDITLRLTDSNHFKQDSRHGTAAHYANLPADLFTAGHKLEAHSLKAINDIGSALKAHVCTVCQGNKTIGHGQQVNCPACGATGWAGANPTREVPE